MYLGVWERQLRYFTQEGEIVPIPTEQLELERRERELAQQQLADMEALLARYRERFGELPD